jgi:curved DNA-binding protein CbpA
MTHYDVLGVARGATAEEIRQAYHRRIFATHPDRAGDGGAEARRVIEAGRVLRHPERRKAYDDTLGPERASRRPRAEAASPGGATGARSPRPPRAAAHPWEAPARPLFEGFPYLRAGGGELRLLWPCPPRGEGPAEVPVVTPAGAVRVAVPDREGVVRLKGAGLAEADGRRGELLVTFVPADDPLAPALRRGLSGTSLGGGALEAELAGLSAEAAGKVRAFLRGWAMQACAHEARRSRRTVRVEEGDRLYRFKPDLSFECVEGSLIEPCRQRGCPHPAYAGLGRCLVHHAPGSGRGGRRAGRGEAARPPVRGRASRRRATSRS